ncbi:F-box protein isoform 4 [Hibiscus syriacus]|uniref:F-box protein isoform 4 n=1 Tax=Hibiscus syriacus TaxID=106335 RepID=A0A6A3BTP8_HIBSY|nr:F-box protein isoform 4 [Hibiscus syriacus]
MNTKTWADRSDTYRFNSFPSSKPDGRQGRTNPPRSTKFGLKPSSQSSRTGDRDFSAFPFDILTKIAAAFNFKNVLSASLVCRSWRDALRLLREAMALSWAPRSLWSIRGLFTGKRVKRKKQLLFIKEPPPLVTLLAGAISESYTYKVPIMFGVTAEQYPGEPQDHKEAIKWLHQASVGGHVRAKYQLALCLDQGFGVERNLQEAAGWYLEAAEGGYVRAMYNASICCTFGEGLSHTRRQARKWMKRAADRGHRKAQFQHGFTLVSEGEMMKAVVYLELAIRSGETAATRVKNVILRQLSGRFVTRPCFFLAIGVLLLHIDPDCLPNFLV